MRKGTLGFSTVVVGLVLALWLVGSAWAQTTGTGAFARLSPGNQTIARALFEAQPKSTTSTASNAPKPLTLDQIASMKQDSEGWGKVFKEMKAQGLVTAKNLGQLVSSYERRHPEAAKLDKVEREKMDKAVKHEKMDGMERVARPDPPRGPRH